MHVYFVAIFAQACIRCFIVIAPLALLSALQLVLLMTDIAYKCECGKYFWNKETQAVQWEPPLEEMIAILEEKQRLEMEAALEAAETTS